MTEKTAVKKLPAHQVLLGQIVLATKESMGTNNDQPRHRFLIGALHGHLETLIQMKIPHQAVLDIVSKLKVVLTNMPLLAWPASKEDIISAIEANYNPIIGFYKDIGDFSCDKGARLIMDTDEEVIKEAMEADLQIIRKIHDAINSRKQDVFFRMKVLRLIEGRSGDLS